jgi:hypothetical protein
LKKKYKYIILPPENFHTTMSDLIIDNVIMIYRIIDILNNFTNCKSEYLIKYRSYEQLAMYPSKNNVEVGYGELLDYCQKDSIVIGYPGSAMIECLKNNVRFFSFNDFEKKSKNPNINTLLTKAIYIAKNEEELLDNILNNKIFKPGYSVKDLLYSDGMSLCEMVSYILNNQKSIK